MSSCLPITLEGKYQAYDGQNRLLRVQGSHDAIAVEEFHTLAAKSKHLLLDYDVESGFFEAAAADDCAAEFPSVGALKAGHV